jgi:hypothetical protein
MAEDQYRRKFLTLVNDICEELEYPPCADAPEFENMLAMEMELGGIAFAMTHANDPAPERVVLEAIFGSPPSINAQEVLQRLMEINRELLSTTTAGFCFDGGSGKITYAYAFSMDKDGKTARSLLETMTQIALAASEWRSSYYLDEKNEEQLQNMMFQLQAFA